MEVMISVIVPLYNVEFYLRRCINSILNQSFVNFELLLIDDGSIDTSGIICNEYAEKDRRIKVFHKENGGVSSARNVGLANAKGTWIAFVDADDWVEPDYLKNLIDHVDDSIDLVISYTQRYTKGANFRKEIYPSKLISDKNFEEMQELETRLKNFEAVFNDFLGKLAGASKRIEALNSNKERADFAVEKLMELDSMLGDIDAKIESVTKARKWLADTESRLVQLNDSAVKNLTTLKEVTELSNLSNGKGKVDQNVLILRLAQQGWSAADIAKKLNVGLGEVQLIIEMNLNK